MAFFKDVGIGAGMFFKTFKFISKHKMWGYFVFPVIVSLLFGFAMFYLKASISAYLTENINDWVGLGQETDSWFLNFLKGTLEFLVVFLVWLLTTLLLFKINKYIVFILLSPILAFVSEKTEKAITGNDYPFVFSQFLSDIMRGVLIALRNILIELFLTIIALPINFIPVIGTIVYTGWVWGVSWYFYGYGLMDYTNERRRLSVRESNISINSMRGVAIGIGLIFSLIFWIPILGFIFAPILGAVAATMAMHEKIDLNNSEFARKAVEVTS